MNAGIINQLIHAAKSVLHSLCQEEAAVGEAFGGRSSFPADSMIIVVGIVGDLRGQVYIELPQETAKGIAGTMMRGLIIQEVDDIGKSAVLEMANMIMGNACILLSIRKLDVDITPPAVLMGSHMNITDSQPTLAVPLILEKHGTVIMHIAIETVTEHKMRENDLQPA
ncbi:chemotaxis protein CheX [Gorillibacterium massiliense]|uniref:chemotaxis protein CheX n=1 Tax=Gorillibacterium massiliense TaxID=1280390 RepID=UPI0004B8CC46|nr:chemotaxis protein CheX [Gorillibacterium massiliense]